MNRKQSNFCGNFPVTDGEGKPLKVMVGLGCMAEFCVVSRANLIKLRPEMPLAKAALVGCATVTGYGTRLIYYNGLLRDVRHTARRPT